MRACSFWEFSAAISGWNAVHGGDSAGGVSMSSEDEDDIWEGVMERMG